MSPVSLARSLALGSGLALLALPASAQRPAPPQPGVIRVCADPDNLPFSNQAGAGFENKLAELIAREWKSKLVYVWYPTRRGYFRILNGMYCDVAIEAPAGLDMAGTTRPYYRSGYVFVARKDSKLADVKSMSDPRLKRARIGVTLLPTDEQGPAVMALSRYGVVGNLRGFNAFYNEQDRPEDLIEAVANKEVDIAIAWGPLAGYFAKRSRVPLTLTPLAEADSASGFPLQYNIGMAVRRRDRDFRDSLNTLIERKQPEIQALLKQYNFPLLPVETERREGEKTTGAAASARSGRG